MKSGEWTLRSRCVVTPEGTRAADILIAGERIAGLADHRGPDREGIILDVGDRLVLPGLIDLRSNPGGPPGWQEKTTGSAAAVGVTTVVELPIPNRPSSPGRSPFDGSLAESGGRLWVDCGFLGALIPGDAGQVARWVETGALGIVADPDRPCAEGPASTVDDLRGAIATLSRLGRPLLILPPPLAANPDRSEADRIRSLIALCRDRACHVHFLGLSTAEGLAAIAEARANGHSHTMTVATSIDHLISADLENALGDSRTGSGPSPRSMVDRERLWDGLRLRMIDAIGSGHRPSAGGLSSKERALHPLWSEARRRGFTPDDLARWMSGRPAEILGLAGRKGSIVADADADFVILEPADSSADGPQSAEDRRAGRPATDPTSTGQVVATILRGQLIYESDRFHGEPQGSPIFRLDETERLPNGLERLNTLGQVQALDLLRDCCGSSRWAWRLLALRPFRSMVDLLDAADRVWSTLDRADRLEAFAAHPRVSDREGLRRERFPKIFKRDAPSGFRDDVLDQLARVDREYEAKFDFRFLVARTDLSPGDVLALIRQRFQNDPEAEHRITSLEQLEIIRAGLRKLISGS